MTKEEAIQLLGNWDGYFIGHSSDDVNEALNMAIEALKEQKTGKWIFDGMTKCSNCSYSPKFMCRWNYCPICGAKMEVKE